MAIYSLQHRPIGKSTQEHAYTASAHIRYITRRRALSRLEGARMPVDQAGAMSFFRKAEDSSRKNARVADKIMLALPKELTAKQRHELVRAFAEEVSKGKAPWLAAYHEKGKDKRNPHCHLVFHDRDPKTAKRVIGMSEKGSTERLREAWERHANLALERAGHEARIDRRTLAAQGIEREPTIHEGPRSREMDRRGARPKSRSRSYRNGRGARRRERRVDYGKIDRGLSRPEYNRSIRAQQAETEQELWAAVDADRRNRELATLRAIHKPELEVPELETQRRFRAFVAKREAERKLAAARAQTHNGAYEWEPEPDR
ncbi:MAG: MobA/MobL family protein [Proteobacteria bacterium]|nr:MobA/MobL family protein [Pseudomonadota bacterium]